MRIDIEEKSLYDMIPSQELEVEEQDENQEKKRK